jgi:competence protein ComEA
MSKPSAALGILLFSCCLLISAFGQSSNGQNSQPANNSQPPPPLTDQSSYPKETHKMSAHEKSQTGAAQGKIVDLNTATKAELAALPGVGPDYAQTIIDARPFTAREQLLQKKLVPPATYNKIKDQVTASGPKKQSTKTPNQ